MMQNYVKVCGLTQSENIEEIIRTGVTHIGFIFYAKTPRCIVDKLDPNYARSLIGIQKTGVFVNAKGEKIERQIEEYGLDLLQLHGDESPGFCRALRSKIPVMKAFTIKTKKDILETHKYEGCCDYFLFDAAGKSPGGNGIVFNWELLDHYKGNTSFFLSGGIGPEQIENLKSFSHPKWVGIDINSKFEIRPGYKDIKKIEEFLQALNYTGPAHSKENQ